MYRCINVCMCICTISFIIMFMYLSHIFERCVMMLPFGVAAHPSFTIGTLLLYHFFIWLFTCSVTDHGFSNASFLFFMSMF